MKVCEILGSEKSIIPVFQNYNDLQKIDSSDFPLNSLNCEPMGNIKDDAQFIAFVVSDNTKKTTIAKAIAHEYDGLYWDLSEIRVSGVTLLGTLAHAIGVGKLNTLNPICKDLVRGMNTLVLDDLDSFSNPSLERWSIAFLRELWCYTSPKAVIFVVTPEECRLLKKLNINDDDLRTSCYEVVERGI